MTTRDRHGATTALDGLIPAARRGESAAWHELFVRYNSLVLAMARRQGLSAAECDDVAQTTWMRFVENVDSIRVDCAVPGWLATTATREAYATARRRNREVPTDQQRMTGEAGQDGDIDEALDIRRLIGRMRSAVATLPDRERRLIEMMLDSDEPTYRQISERLQMPIGAIGPVRQRAVRRLQVMLAAFAPESALSPAH